MANDFLPFAGGVGANVLTQSAYAALAARTAGFSSGLAKSAELNKVWRQSSIMAATLAQLIADYTGADVIDDGTTATILSNLKTAVSGRLIAVQVITSNGTFTPDPRTKSVVVEAVGGGGAAGGVPATDGSSYSMGGAGAAATYGRGRYTSGFSGVAMTIGQGGVGVAGANGGAGGTTSFGSLLSCPGGPGGSAGTTFASTAQSLKATALGSNAAVGANISYCQGARGIFGISLGGSQVTSDGGASFFGPGGGGAGLNIPGNNATNPGSGGSSRFSGTSNPAIAGGNGANGLIIVWEFA